MGMRVKDEFDIARDRAMQQANAAKQQQSDVLKRRFAAAGMVNSGAAIQQERLANEAADKQLAQANEGIDASQRAEFQRRKEIEDARKFQTAEREASQGFAGSQAEMAQKLQRDLFDKDLGFKQAVQKTTENQFDRQIGMAEQQALQDAQITDYNMQIAARESGIPYYGMVDTSGMNYKDGLKAIRESAMGRRLFNENIKNEMSKPGAIDIRLPSIGAFDVRI